MQEMASEGAGGEKLHMVTEQEDVEAQTQNDSNIAAPADAEPPKLDEKMAKDIAKRKRRSKYSLADLYRYTSTVFLENTNGF